LLQQARQKCSEVQLIAVKKINQWLIFPSRMIRRFGIGRKRMPVVTPDPLTQKEPKVKIP
jgi:hypothetical protein